jgi:hypothetical protein
MVPVPEKVYTNIHARQRWDTMWQSDWVTLPPAKRNNDTLNFETTEHGFIIQNQPDGGYTLVRPALRFDIARYQDLALFGEIVEDNHPIVTCDLDETIDPLPWSRARVFRIVPDGPNIVIASIVFANVHTEHTRRARIDVLAHTK